MSNFDNIIVLPFEKANFCVDAFALTNVYENTPNNAADTLEVSVVDNKTDNDPAVTYEVPIEDFEGFLRNKGELSVLVPTSHEDYDKIEFSLADWREVTDRNLQYDAVSSFLQSKVFAFADEVEKEIAAVNKIKKEEMAIFDNAETLAYRNNQIAKLQTVLDIAQCKWAQKTQL